MALNLEFILEHVGESVDAFSENVGIPTVDLFEYATGEKKPPVEVYANIADYTGLSWDKLEKTQKKEVKESGVHVIDTWAPSETAKRDIKEYILEGKENLFDKDIVGEILKVEKCLTNWKKPKITFAGQSDTGKSTIINELLGSNKVPAKWTPTTSIAIYIKHINDRPVYINDEVWIFGKKDGELWDESLLHNEEYTKSFCIKQGTIALLEEYGTHQAEKVDYKEAFSAIVFLESDVLKTCDIVDLPGFAANDEDDTLHRISTQNSSIDILVYLSRANGFLQDRDIDYLSVCLDSLAPLENNIDNVDKLGNLFIVATHATAVNEGNVSSLTEILDRQCARLAVMLRQSAKIGMNNDKTLLPLRTEYTHMNYTEEDLRERFFTYDKSLKRLNRQYIDNLSYSLENIPKKIHNNFKEGLNKIAEDSKTFIKSRISLYIQMVENTEKYIKLAKAIRVNEPARKAEQSAKKESLCKLIDKYCIESKQEISSFLTTYLSEQNLINEMKNMQCKNKKEDKELFVTTVNKVINNKLQTIVDKKSKDYSDELDSYLKEYEQALISKSEDFDVKLGFNTVEVFAMGISALTVMGASAVWLTTSAEGIIVFLIPCLAKVGDFIAVGGVIAVGIAAIVLGAIAFVNAVTWKSKLANSIIKAYIEKQYEIKIHAEIEKFWADTNSALDVGCKKIEEEWEYTIKEYEELGRPEAIKEQQEKINRLQTGLLFFEQMPMP